MMLYQMADVLAVYFRSQHTQIGLWDSHIINLYRCIVVLPRSQIEHDTMGICMCRSSRYPIAMIHRGRSWWSSATATSAKAVATCHTRPERKANLNAIQAELNIGEGTGSLLFCILHFDASKWPREVSAYGTHWRGDMCASITTNTWVISEFVLVDGLIKIMRWMVAA